MKPSPRNITRRSKAKSRKSKAKSRKAKAKSRKAKSRKSKVKSRKAKSRKRLGTKKCDAKWTTLEHNGVIFPESYEQKDIPLLYGKSSHGGKKNGGKQSILLNGEAEEAAMFYSKVLHLDHSTNPTFRKNFFADWKKLLPKNTEIKSLDDCDFTNFQEYIAEDAADRKQYTKSKKSRVKEIKERAELKYTTAKVDGKKQSVGNFRVEPPGLFLGRGKHPKAGKIKKRIHPEDIILNIGDDAKIPTPPKGHDWGEVIHDHCAVWLASWKENINNDTKYVWLGQDADFKRDSDQAKFELARELRNNFDKIRKQNMDNILTVGADSDKLRQLAVALYLIDTLVLRVGNEKGSDEADTVGVASLRVEHIHLLSNNMVELDFLGKDSVRFQKKFKVPVQIYAALKEFTDSKNKTTSLFELINAKDINIYLKDLMPGLTAKVFRTANASNLYQDELNKIKYKKDEKTAILINRMNKANAEVAIMCNHKKKVSRGFAPGIDKINDQIKIAKDKLKELKAKDNQTSAIKKQQKTKTDKIRELKAKLETKKHMKEVATGTAKINYIDPRITVAFAKKHDIELGKVFNKVQQKKFKWAEDVGPRWTF